MFPQMDVQINTATQVSNRTFQFDFDKGEFNIHDGKLTVIDGIEAIKQWINKVLKTERNRYRIYDDSEYGVSTEDLIMGQDIDSQFIEAEIKREIKEALTKHNSIRNITNFMMTKVKDQLVISFNVVLDDTTFTQEVIL